jgi:hypothetical protein
MMKFISRVSIFGLVFTLVFLASLSEDENDRQFRHRD